jgi:heme oxygenase (mycobilin-producing)
VSGPIRVLVWYRCPHADLDGLAATFRAIGAQLAGVPGLIGSELLQAQREEGSIVVMSEWESTHAFAAWEASNGHRATTAPLRQYLDTTRPYPFDRFQILATFLPQPAAEPRARNAELTT